MVTTSQQTLIVEVSCVKKADRYNPHERIRSIGGVHAAKRWLLSQQDAIAGIKSSRWKFYVERPTGHRVWVIIAKHAGVEYLKTEADGEQPNNLLALPECPV